MNSVSNTVLKAPDDGNLVLVDPTVDLGSEDEEDALMIDCSDEEEEEEDEDGYDPLSLVSVGLDEDEDDMEEDEDDLSFEEKNNEASCTFCSESFSNRKLLNNHILSVHQKACSVACQYCGRVLSDADSYKRHLNNVHQVNIPELNSSSTKLSKAKKLKPVFSIPSLVKKCPDCDQQFATKTTLNIHRLKVHVAGLQNLPCPQCGQEAADLTSHMRRHHNVEGIVCPHCANIFSKKCTLNRHIEQVHLNIQIHKPATCPQCNKIFSKKGHLDRHIKIIHQGIKDFSDPCPYCGKVFTTRASLEPHIAMVHEGVRKKCSICNKVLSDLNKHMRTVHGTYRRRAKIPKDLIGELDNPEAEISPQIYGASSGSKISPEPESDADIELEYDDGSVDGNGGEEQHESISITPLKKENGRFLSSSTKFELHNDQSTESIKEELGLSAGITLQKIVRPNKSLPKLLYCGPKQAKSPTEVKLPSSAPLSEAHQQCQRDQTESSNAMVKITGKFSRKVTELLPHKKTVQNI